MTTDDHFRRLLGVHGATDLLRDQLRLQDSLQDLVSITQLDATQTLLDELNNHGSVVDEFLDSHAAVQQIQDEFRTGLESSWFEQLKHDTLQYDSAVASIANLANSGISLSPELSQSTETLRNLSNVCDEFASLATTDIERFSAINHKLGDFFDELSLGASAYASMVNRVTSVSNEIDHIRNSVGIESLLNLYDDTLSFEQSVELIRETVRQELVDETSSPIAFDGWMNFATFLFATVLAIHLFTTSEQSSNESEARILA